MFAAVLRAIRDRNILLVYWAIFILGMAYGISLALTPLHMTDRGFSKQDIGGLAVFFAAGVVALSLPMGSLIKRFTARTTLLVSLLGYAAAITVFPFAHSYATIALVRSFDGAFSVGIWVSCETILLARADNAHKAMIASLYAIAMGVGYVVGPILARILLIFIARDYCFVVAGGIAACGAFFAAARLDGNLLDEDRSSRPPEELFHTDPSRPAPRPKHSWQQLLWRIKTSCFATFAYGYFQASVVLFLPLYLIESKHVPPDRTILTTAFFAAGMLLVTNFTARLGDRFGHLLLMRVLAIIGTATVVSFDFLPSFWMMCVAVFLAGATLATISPVSLALQGVVVERRELAQANSIYNVFYASGMLLGPLLSSRLFQHYGGPTMMWHLVILWSAFVLFTIVFAQDDPHVRKATTLAARSAEDTA